MAYIAVCAVFALGFAARVVAHRRHLVRMATLKAENDRLREANAALSAMLEPVEQG